MYAQNKNITYVDDLPELEDLEHNNNSEFSEQNIPEKFRKFIRRPMGPAPMESGMAPYNPPYNQQEQQQLHSHPQQHSQNFLVQQPPMPGSYSLEENSKSPTCLEIADHVSNCPICSKFYKNDNSIYIIAIIILSIMCVLLLKRVLDL